MIKKATTATTGQPAKRKQTNVKMICDYAIYAGGTSFARYIRATQRRQHSGDDDDDDNDDDSIADGPPFADRMKKFCI